MTVPKRTRGALQVRARRSPFARRIRIPVLTFIHAATTGGIALLGAVLIAMILANSPWADIYDSFWATELRLRIGPWSMSHDLRYWVNDGLMTWFFFVVALEIKRELAFGELSTTRRAALPFFAALGGMIVPVAAFLALNLDEPGSVGWGIPMATDIAFALGVLALVGDRVPNETRIFLLGLAVVDDVGAILVIALAYVGDLSLPYLVLAGLIFAFMAGALRLGVRNPVLYMVAGVSFWFCVLLSGVHATIAGVAVGLLVPASPIFRKQEVVGELSDLTRRFEEALDRGDDEIAEEEMGAIEELARRTEPPVERLERLAHPFSSYLVLPLFALANAGLALPDLSQLSAALDDPLVLGIVLGLAVGKPVGILGCSWLAERAGLASRPKKVSWAQIAGVGMLGGIGFTVSLFIAHLAFGSEGLLNEAKLGIALASALSALAGFAWFRFVARTAVEDQGTV